MTDPNLLVSGDYSLDIDDFPHRFHKLIFSSINYLYSNKLNVSIVDIDNHISHYQEQYQEFQNNKGIEYLEACKRLASIDNYNEHCKIVKKFSLLRDAENQKLNVKEIYDPDNEDKVKKFSAMTIPDIIGHYNKKILTLEQKYCNIKDGIHASEYLEQQLANYAETPEMGLDCGINALNYITFGLRAKYYLISSPSGYGKTRTLCRLASYASIMKQEPTLFISTELDTSEIQAMVLAGVSGVQERNIILNQCSEKEKVRLQKAVKYIEDSKLHIVHMPDFDIEKLEYIIKKYILLHKVKYIFFDYIKLSMSMLTSVNKKAGGGLQGYQILTLLSEKLKSISATYDVGIYSATQVSTSNYFGKDSTGSNQSQLAGAKAIADFADVGMILRPASEAEIDKYELDFRVRDINNTEYQHMILDIYKNRRGMKDIGIALYVNLGKLDYQETCVIKNEKVLNIPKVVFD